MADAILRLPAVKTRTGLSRSTLYDYIAKGRFPPPIQLGDRAVGWLSGDVDRWLERRIEASRSSAA